uniref:Uncharacterized protein n=1 Tax=Rhizophora mucronata TaxID=61149 RepID=A0A2P2P7X1_RHIMU
MCLDLYRFTKCSETFSLLNFLLSRSHTIICLSSSPFQTIHSSPLFSSLCISGKVLFASLRCAKLSFNICGYP